MLSGGPSPASPISLTLSSPGNGATLGSGPLRDMDLAQALRTLGIVRLATQAEVSDHFSE